MLESLGQQPLTDLPISFKISMNCKQKVLLSTVALLGFQAYTHANPILQNGSFETGDFTGWSATGNVVVSSSGSTYFAQFNAFQDPPTGVIAQTFATTPGANYALTFDYGDYNDGSVQPNGATQTMDVKLTGTSTLLSTTAISPGSVGGAFPPVTGHYTEDFTANSISTTLQFTDDPANNTDHADGVLNNIVVVETQGVPDSGPGLTLVATLLIGVFGLSRKVRHSS